MLCVGNRYAYGVRKGLTKVVEVTRVVENFITSNAYYGQYVVGDGLGKKEIRLDIDRVGCEIDKGGSDNIAF